MTEIIIISLMTAGSALSAVFITQYYELKKRKSEERRWYADHFMDRKINALSNLHVTLVDCKYTMNYYGNCPPQTLHEFNSKILPKEQNYLRAYTLASIYLDKDTKDSMGKVLGSFNQASFAIWLSLPDSECHANKKSYVQSTKTLDWNGLDKTYNTAVSCLENLLSPEVLSFKE